MKRIAPVFFTLIIILSGCGSSTKQLEKGNYDAAIDMAVRQALQVSQDPRWQSSVTEEKLKSN